MAKATAPNPRQHTPTSCQIVTQRALMLGDVAIPVTTVQCDREEQPIDLIPMMALHSILLDDHRLHGFAAFGRCNNEYAADANNRYWLRLDAFQGLKGKGGAVIGALPARAFAQLCRRRAQMRCHIKREQQRILLNSVGAWIEDQLTPAGRVDWQRSYNPLHVTARGTYVDWATAQPAIRFGAPIPNQLQSPHAHRDPPAVVLPAAAPRTGSEALLLYERLGDALQLCNDLATLAERTGTGPGYLAALSALIERARTIVTFDRH